MRPAVLTWTVTCVAAAVLHVWPGVLGLGLLVALTATPFITISAACLGLLDLKGARTAIGRLLGGRKGLALGTAAAMLLLGLRVAPRCALVLSQGELDALIPAASASSADKPFERWAGLFPIEAAAADQRGGVYFRTLSTRFIDIDTTSYGLVRDPNGYGSPFGNAHYSTWHLVGDWYGFTANSDW